jgi:hypothetical protein
VLPDVKGRIDHLAFDPARQRLFVAELGNNTVDVIDMKAGKAVQRLTGLREPQGLGYVPQTDTLYVANAGDGSVRLYNGESLTPSGRLDLGEDADNVRVSPQGDRVYIGHGSGAIAVLEPATATKLADIPLKGHPEGFQVDASSARVYVNVPDVDEVAVLDLHVTRQVAAWPTGAVRAVFPMALDGEAHEVIVVGRRPPKLLAYDTEAGRVKTSLDVCGDADDVFVDSKRHRLYVSCGEGVLDVFERTGASYARVQSVPTAPGARTALLAPSMDWLVVAAPARDGKSASLLLFRPLP